MFDIAIIGFGATGVSLLKEIQNRVYALGLKPPRVVLFSPHDSFAKGNAFGDAAPVHRVNTPPHMLSVSGCEPTGFSHWLGRHKNTVELYPSRLTYSTFLQETYTSIVQSPLLEIEEIRQNVLSISRHTGRYQIKTQHEKVYARKVVLCLGSVHGSNFSNINEHDGFIDHHNQLNQITDKRVLVAGTGLSAVDIFRSLQVDPNREIHLFSRCGNPPTCLAKENRYLPQVLTWNAFINLRSHKLKTRLPYVWKKFKEEVQRIPGGGEHNEAAQILQTDGLASYHAYLLKRAQNADCPFQDILVSTRPYIHNIWISMPIKDRIAFDKKYRSHWAAWRHPIPYEVFSEMAGAAKEGRLYIHSVQNKPRIENGQFVVTTHTGKTIKSKNFIDGTGGNNCLKSIDSPLLHSLEKKNLIEAHPCGGITISPLTFQCYVKEKAIPDLYNIGPLNRGSLFSTNAFWFNARCASQWANQWAIEMCQ